MAISMKHGRGDLDSVDAKTRTYELGRAFMTQFAARNGSCICAQILGIDVGTAEGHKQAQEARLFETKCLEAVKSAADILDVML
jgi:C_GCAxxG_C_C family probable redox protein